MKILHVINTLHTGGAEHLMVDLLPRLRDLGDEVDLCVFNGERTPFFCQLEEAGIVIHVLGMGNVYNPLLIPKLRRLMNNYDIVHTHNTSPQLFAAMGKNSHTKLVTTEHSTSTRRRNHILLRLLDRWMYRQYDEIICISQPSEDSLRNYLGKGYPIKTILNGVDVNRFLNAAPVDLGLDDCVKITMVAGFRYEKDQPTLIRSLRHLPANYHVLLVGDGVKRVELESLVKEENLESRVHFLGIRTDVPSVLKSSDIIVMSSHREGLSLSNVEGMASGHPFIASDVEGLREVTDGYGVLFPHEDAQTLAAEIIRLDSDAEYAQRVSQRCRQRALEYDIAKMAQNYSNEYKYLYQN